MVLMVSHTFFEVSRQHRGVFEIGTKYPRFYHVINGSDIKADATNRSRERAEGNRAWLKRDHVAGKYLI